MRLRGIYIYMYMYVYIYMIYYLLFLVKLLVMGFVVMCYCFCITCGVIMGVVSTQKSHVFLHKINPCHASAETPCIY